MNIKKLSFIIIVLLSFAVCSNLYAQCSITITYSSPYEEDFSQWTANTSYSQSGIMPDCWGVIHTGEITSSHDYTPHVYRGTPCPNGSSNNALLLTSGCFDEGTNNYVIMPEFTNDLNDLQIRFATAMSSSLEDGRLTLGYITDVESASTFSAIANIPYNYYNDYPRAEHEFTLGDYNLPAGVRLAFRWYSNSSSERCCIDDIRIRITPACQSVINASIAHITTSGAQISWTSRGSETGWNVEVVPLGGAQGTGTVYQTTANPYVLTGQNPNSSYEVYIQANCGSEWTYAGSFTTHCDALTISSSEPYEEDFTNWSANTSYNRSGIMPDCWGVIHTGEVNASHDYTPHVYRGTPCPNGSSNNALLLTSGCFDEGTNNYVIMPEFTNDLNDLQISFATAMSSSLEDGRLTLGYITDVESASTFSAIANIPYNYYNDYPRAEHEFTLGDYNLPAGVRLAFRWYSNSSSERCCIDDIRIRMTPSCQSVINASIAHITTSGAQISWTSRGNETGWNVEVVPLGGAQGTGTVYQTTMNPYVLTGQNPNSSYEVYIQANCGSEWTYAGSFTTHCNALTVSSNAPYEEDFSSWTANTSYNRSGIMPDCWGVIHTGEVNASHDYTPHVYRGTPCPNGSSNNALLLTSGCFDEGTNNYVIMPEFTNDLNDLQISFTTAMSSSLEDGRLTLGYISDVESAGTYVPVVNIPYNYYNDYPRAEHEFTLGDYNLPSGVRLAFRWYSTSSSERCCIDDIRLRITPTCQSVINASISHVTTSGAQISWTSRGSETGWNIEVVPEGGTQGTGTMISTTNNPYMLGGQTPNSTYEIYIQANCGSEWTYAGSFTTHCDALTISSSEPYEEDFTNWSANTSYNRSGIMPDCWGVIHTGEVNASHDYTPHVYRGTPCPNGSSNNALLLTSGCFDEGTNNYVIMPEFTNDLNDLQISFTTAMSSSLEDGRLTLGYISDVESAGTYVPVVSIPYNYYNDYPRAEHEFTLGDYNLPSGVRLAFRWYSTSSSERCCIDDIRLMITPPICSAPENINILDIEDSSIEFAWEGNGLESGWNIEYGVAGFVLGTGIRMDHASSPVTINNLAAHTTYDIYIQSICTDGDLSEWSSAFSITTQCETVNITVANPFTEYFTQYLPVNYNAEGVIPDCWYSASSGNSAPLSVHVNFGFGNGHGNALILTSGNDYGLSNYIVLPTIQNAYDELELSFTTAMTNVVTGVFTLGYVSTFGDTSSYVILETIPNNNCNAPVLHEFQLSDYAIPDGANLAFRWQNFAGSWSCYLDDIIIRLRECEVPTNISIQSITSHSAEISWTAAPMTTAYEIEYGLHDFVLGTGTRVQVNGNSYVLNNLLPNMEYDIYVRSVCGNNNESDWSSVGSFTTEDNVSILEYGNDFLLYPNPANSSCIIEGGKIQEIRVLNMHGQLIQKNEVGGSQRYGVDVGGLQSGVYIIHIVTTEQRVLVYKLVVQH